jgi:hypothetical protein
MIDKSIHFLIVFYAILLFLGKYAGDVFVDGSKIIVLLIVIVSFSSVQIGFKKRFVPLIVLISTIVLASFLLNSEHSKMEDGIKLLSFIFLAAVKKEKWNDRNFDKVVFLILALAALGLAIDILIYGQWVMDVRPSIFINRSMLGSTVTILAILFVQVNYPNSKFLLRFGILTTAIALKSATSFIVSTIFTLRNLKSRQIFTIAIPAVAIVLVFYSTFYSLLRGNRITSIFNNIILVLSTENNFSSLEYSQLYTLTGSGDLSFFFRIRHWIDLLDIYTNGSFVNIMLGFGPRSSEALSFHALVPHNDYIRLLFDYGLLGFCAFSILFIQVYRLSSANIRIVFLCLAVFMLTENVLDNTLVMTLMATKIRI